jgi:starvation-inducible DNA-binding protein
MASKFNWEFALEGKAVEGADGDLYIEGYASDFDIDRDGEYIVPGALQKALDSYMKNPVLCYHHNMSQAMGQVVEAHVDAKGLWIKARVDQPEPGTDAANRFRQVAKGTLRGFSIGGFFRKAVERGRTMINDIDLVEISLTPTPVNPRTLGTVVGKALDDDAAEGEAPETPLVEALETVLGSVVVLYFMAHGSHWNVKGPAFGAYHELFEEIYEDIYESIDPIAEQMLKQGVDACFSLSDFLEESIISSDEPADDSPEALVTMLLTANSEYLTALNALFAIATADDQQGIANMVADRIDMHMKWAWQLRRSIQNSHAPSIDTAALDSLEAAFKQMS